MSLAERIKDFESTLRVCYSCSSANVVIKTVYMDATNSLASRVICKDCHTILKSTEIPWVPDEINKMEQDEIDFIKNAAI